MAGSVNEGTMPAEAHTQTHTAATSSPPLVRPRGFVPRPRYCKECGHPFYPARHDQDYCRPKCRQAWHKRRYERGAQLYDFAMAWRGKRLKGGFTRLCQMLDEWLRDERDRRKACKRLREKCRADKSPKYEGDMRDHGRPAVPEAGTRASGPSSRDRRG